jgi:hypothetical protein
MVMASQKVHEIPSQPTAERGGMGMSSQLQLEV